MQGAVTTITAGEPTLDFTATFAMFYGGLIQLLAGMWEMWKNNTFAATAFSSYGERFTNALARSSHLFLRCWEQKPASQLRMTLMSALRRRLLDGLVPLQHPALGELLLHLAWWPGL